MSKFEIWYLKLWFATLKGLNKCFGCSQTCKRAYWLYFMDSIELSFQNAWIRKTSFDLCIRKYWFLEASHEEITKWKASRICIHKQTYLLYFRIQAVLWVSKSHIPSVILNETLIRIHCWGDFKNACRKNLHEVTL